MNAMINTSTIRLPKFLSWLFTAAPSPKEITSFDGLAECDLESYLHFVINNVQCLTSEVYARIDAITRNPARYSFRIRMVAEHALIRHSASKPN